MGGYPTPSSWRSAGAGRCPGNSQLGSGPALAVDIEPELLRKTWHRRCQKEKSLLRGGPAGMGLEPETGLLGLHPRRR